MPRISEGIIFLFYHLNQYTGTPFGLMDDLTRCISPGKHTGISELDTAYIGIMNCLTFRILENSGIQDLSTMESCSPISLLVHPAL